MGYRSSFTVLCLLSTVLLARLLVACGGGGRIHQQGGGKNSVKPAFTVLSESMVISMRGSEL